MTNKLLWQVIGNKLTEQQLNYLFTNGLELRYQVRGSWLRWNGSGFYNFEGFVTEATPGQITIIEPIPSDCGEWEQWGVTKEMFEEHGLKARRKREIAQEEARLKEEKIRLSEVEKNKSANEAKRLREEAEQKARDVIAEKARIEEEEKRKANPGHSTVK